MCFFIFGIEVDVFFIWRDIYMIERFNIEEMIIVICCIKDMNSFVDIKKDFYGLRKGVVRRDNVLCMNFFQRRVGEKFWMWFSI